MVNRVRVFLANHLVDKHPPTTRDYIEVTVGVVLLTVGAFTVSWWFGGMV